MSDPVTTLINVAVATAAAPVFAGLLGGGGGTDVEGPRLGEQDPVRVAEGAQMPRYAGRRARIPGTVIWCTKIKEVKKKASAGSGKSGGSFTSYRYTVDIAISFGQAWGGVDEAGEIQKLLKIKANGKTIYNSSKPKKGKHRYQSLSISRGSATNGASSILTAAKGSGKVPGFRNTVHVIFNDLELDDFGNGIPQVWDAIVEPDAYPKPLGEVVRDVWRRMPNRTLAEVDVSELTGENTIELDDLGNRDFQGLQTLGIVSPQYVLDVLEVGFDAYHQETNGVLVMKDRGKETLVEIKAEHLGATDAGDGEARELPVHFSKREDLTLPSEVSLNYIAEDQGYKRSAVRQKIDIAPTESVVQLELPLLLKREQARRIARRRGFEPHRFRDEVDLNLPPDYFRVQPNDVVHFPFEGQRYYCRVLEKTAGANWRIELRGLVVDVRGEADQILSSVAGSWAGDLEDTIDALDPSETGNDDDDDGDEYDPPVLATAYLNLPAITDEENDVAGFYLAHAGQDVDAAWIGAQLFNSVKSSSGFKELAADSISKENVIGFALNALPDSLAKWGFIDRKNYLDVQFFEGSGASISDEEMESGINWLAVGQGNDFEVIAYRDAEVIDAVTITAPVSDCSIVAPDIISSASLDFVAEGVKVGRYVRIFGFQEEENVDLFRKVVAISPTNEIQVETTPTTELVNEGGGGLQVTVSQGSIYRLSHFFRGLRNTEDHASQHASGDTVVGFEAPEQTWLQHSKGMVGKKRFYKDVPAGLTTADVSAVPFVSLGETLRPFSPCDVRAKSISDVDPTVISWLHRSRLRASSPTSTPIHALWWNEEWGKHGDRTKYRVEVFTDSGLTTKVRQADVVSQHDHETPTQRVSWAYTPSAQATDGTAGTTVWVRVRQIAKPPTVLGNPTTIEVALP